MKLLGFLFNPSAAAVKASEECANRLKAAIAKNSLASIEAGIEEIRKLGFPTAEAGTEIIINIMKLHNTSLLSQLLSTNGAPLAYYERDSISGKFTRHNYNEAGLGGDVLLHTLAEGIKEVFDAVVAYEPRPLQRLLGSETPTKTPKSFRKIEGVAEGHAPHPLNVAFSNERSKHVLVHAILEKSIKDNNSANWKSELSTAVYELMNEKATRALSFLIEELGNPEISGFTKLCADNGKLMFTSSEMADFILHSIKSSLETVPSLTGGRFNPKDLTMPLERALHIPFGKGEASTKAIQCIASAGAEINIEKAADIIKNNLNANCFDKDGNFIAASRNGVMEVVRTVLKIDPAAFIQAACQERADLLAKHVSSEKGLDKAL